MTMMPTHERSPVERLRAATFHVTHPFKKHFECPICGYKGPFRDLVPETGRRLHAKCPSCGALERHRLQYLVAQTVFAKYETRSLRMLHFAPEIYFRGMFASLFGKYETADIDMKNVDHAVDLQALPFASGAYDVVYASHVLEHVPNDNKAIAEIRRILTSNGFAILPVPIVNPVTVEYPGPNPCESMHVRAPGPDYFNRFLPHFARIDLFRSTAFPPQYQLFAYENRTRYPTEESPLRVAMGNESHVDVVPVCWAS